MKPSISAYIRFHSPRVLRLFSDEDAVFFEGHLGEPRKSFVRMLLQQLDSSNLQPRTTWSQFVSDAVDGFAMGLERMYSSVQATESHSHHAATPFRNVADKTSGVTSLSLLAAPDDSRGTSKSNKVPSGVTRQSAARGESDENSGMLPPRTIFGRRDKNSLGTENAAPRGIPKIAARGEPAKVWR